jgi:hypothetical protein
MHREERRIVAFLQLLQQIQTISYQLSGSPHFAFSSLQCGPGRIRSYSDEDNTFSEGRFVISHLASL